MGNILTVSHIAYYTYCVSSYIEDNQYQFFAFHNYIIYVAFVYIRLHERTEREREKEFHLFWFFFAAFAIFFINDAWKICLYCLFFMHTTFVERCWCGVKSCWIVNICSVSSVFGPVFMTETHKFYQFVFRLSLCFRFLNSIWNWLLSIVVMNRYRITYEILFMLRQTTISNGKPYHVNINNITNYKTRIEQRDESFYFIL